MNKQSIGFTLIEVLLVLFIVGLAATLVVPYTTENPDSRLHREAMHLRNLLQWLADQNLYAGKQVRWILNLNEQAYAGEMKVDDQFQALPAELPQGRKITPEIGKIAWAWAHEYQFSLISQVEIEFDSSGPGYPILVHFSHPESAGYSVLYRAQDGRAKLLQGLVEWHEI